MTLKDYKSDPDKEMFGKIQRRLAVRRAIRMGGVAAVVAVGVVAATLLLWPRNEAVTVTQNDAVLPDGAVGTELVSPATGDLPDVEYAVRGAEDATVASEPQHVAPAMAGTQPMQAEPVAVERRHTAATTTLPEVAATVRGGAEEHQASTGTAVTDEVRAADTTAETEFRIENNSELRTPSSELAKAGQPMPHYDNVIWAPNVIIPDGEVEENRTFTIKATSEISDFHLHIYNRSGRRIYLTTDPQFAWDGTMEGTRMPQGAYVWVATFRDSDGVARQEKGTVVVLR